jgi:hypothetical protein
MKIWNLILTVAVLALAARVLMLERDLTTLQTNTAIAVLSAESANDKIGAISPFFAPDPEKFVRAWLDGTNLPGAVFPDEVLAPLRADLEKRRSTPFAKQQAAELLEKYGKAREN